MSKSQIMMYEVEKYEIEWFTSGDDNYTDRGMVKWMGMMLSDYLEDLIEPAKERLNHLEKRSSLWKNCQSYYSKFIKPTNLLIKRRLFLKNVCYYKMLNAELLSIMDQTKCIWNREIESYVWLK